MLISIIYSSQKVKFGNEWIKCGIFTQQTILTIKENEVMIPATTCMNCEYVKLSQSHQAQKTTYSVIPLEQTFYKAKVDRGGYGGELTVHGFRLPYGICVNGCITLSL